MTVNNLLDSGFSLIPVERRGKVPVGKWAHAQAERASSADVALWQADGLNLGVVTGAISELVVIDCDNAGAVARVNAYGHEPTPTVLTGRGVHLYFAHPGHPVRNAVALETGIDIRGDGGFCVVPPSVHANGMPYRWAAGLSLEDLPRAPLPAWALRAVTASQTMREPGEWTKLFAETAGKGGRNQRCAELAGYLLRCRVEPGVVETVLLQWNERYCSPSMMASEVSRTVRSIAERERRRRLND